MTAIRHEVVAVIEGDLDSVLRAPHPETPDMIAILNSLNELAFIVETVAHLQGKEATLLPAADRARELIKKLSPR